MAGPLLHSEVISLNNCWTIFQVCNVKQSNYTWINFPHICLNNFCILLSSNLEGHNFAVPWAMMHSSSFENLSIYITLYKQCRSNFKPCYLYVALIHYEGMNLFVTAVCNGAASHSTVPEINFNKILNTIHKTNRGLTSML